jgi:hypothetical protein
MEQRRQVISKCQRCGKEFSHRAGRTPRCCSDLCAQRLRSENTPSVKLHRECTTCGKPFTCYPSNPVNCCSRECYDKPRSEGKRITATCPTCKKEYTYKKSWPLAHCSRDCATKDPIKLSEKLAPSPHDRACEQCSKPFRMTPKATRGRFCSLACWGKWQSANIVGDAHPRKGKKKEGPPKEREMISLVCEICKEAYQARQDHAHRSRACSRRCAGKLGYAKMKATKAAQRKPRIELICAICKQPFVPEPCREETRKVCSKKCGYKLLAQRTGPASWHWKGGKLPFYGESWPDARRTVVKRDKVCQDCGRRKEENGRALSVHHIKAFRSFGVERHLEANALENLILLCNPCHMHREHGPEGILATAPNPRNKGQKWVATGPSTRYTYKPR